MDPESIQALTFDCYGTLVDWESGILSVLRPWAKRAGVDAEDEELLEAFAQAEPACEASMPGQPYPVILRAVHARLSARFGVQPDREAAQELASSVGLWPAFPDTSAALRRLAGRFRLVVVSNVDRASFAATSRLLGVAFDAVVTAEEVGAYKPDMRMFRRALEVLKTLGVEPSALVHVAQSLYHDHAPARSLGLRTVWVDRRQGRASQGATPPAPPGVHPDWTVASMQELADRLGV
ncbi:MAG: haloacid dehalogenase type II [Candidatus Polarisedimenticolia bacterium]